MGTGLNIQVGVASQNVRTSKVITLKDESGKPLVDSETTRINPATGPLVEASYIGDIKSSELSWIVSGRGSYGVGKDVKMLQGGVAVGALYAFFAGGKQSWGVAAQLGPVYTHVAEKGQKSGSELGALVLFEISGQFTENWALVGSGGVVIPSIEKRQELYSLGVRYTF